METNKFNKAVLVLKSLIRRYGYALLAIAVAVSLAIGVSNSIALTAAETAPVVEVGYQALGSLRTGTLYADRGNVTTLTTTESVVTNFTATTLTGTLATANQPNVTNIGTQPYLTATNFSVANIMPSGSGSASNVNYCMSGDCDTGLYYPGDNNIGLATGGAVRAQVSNTGVDVTGALSVGTVSFTGPIKYGYSASQADMSTISHGFATTPTACLVTPQTATLSATVEAIATSVFTVSVGATGPVFWMCGQ